MADDNTPVGQTPADADEDLDLLGDEPVQPPDEGQGEPPEDILNVQVPPELQAQWDEYTKGYKKAYTQKTQEIAEQRRQLEAKLRDAGQQEYKARLFDQLVSNPDVQEALYAQRQAGLSQPAPPAETNGAGTGMDPRITQMQQVLTQMQSQFRAQEVQREIEAFKAKNPHWERFQEGMGQAFRENPQLRPQEAYDLAVYRAAKARAADRKRTPPAPVERPQTGVRSQGTGDADSLDSAFAAALRQFNVRQG